MSTAVINRAQIIAQLDSGDLFISPRPSDDLIQEGSVDLRVGSFYLSAERSSLPSVDSKRPWEAARLFSELRIRKGEGIYIQPRQFLLASTLEYISLPKNLCGIIQSRSTYGRMGIIAATAAFVGPGYKGSPTLELVNAGEVTIQLRPYAPICQLLLMPADAHAVKPSRYQCATRPHFARPRNRD